MSNFFHIKIIPYIIGVLTLLSIPYLSWASNTYHAVCPDWTLQNGLTCSAGVFAGMTTSNSAQAYETTAFIVSANTTYYVSYTGSGTGTGRFFFIGSGGDNPQLLFTNGVHTAQSVSMPSDFGTFQYIYIEANGGFTGSISGVCFTNTSGACETVASSPNPLVRWYEQWIHL